jgi:hypothetical protein
MDPDSTGNSIQIVKWLFDVINWAFDSFLPMILIGGLFIAVIIYTRNKIQKEGSAKGMYLGTVLALEMFLLITVIYLLPKLIALLPWITDDTAAIRWFMFLIAIPIWYFFTREHSNLRGVISVSFLLVTFFVGWSYNRWVGILAISLPILLIFLLLIHRTAQVIYPVSNPDDKKEARQKTRMFLSYLLGIQYPVWMPKSRADHEFDERIKGDTKRDIGMPGMIWSWPHQAIGSSIGIEFNKVDGPGAVFTRKYEKPVALVDLRLQLRSTTVNTVTKDGMEIPAVVIAAFAIDQARWPKAEWSRADFSRLKHRIGKDYKIDRTEGSFPYSTGRIRAALGTHGVMIPGETKDKKHSPLYWDDWVVAQVEHVTRQVVSERSLDELWRPKNDGRGASALNEMSDELTKRLTQKLQEAGVQLYAARIVNYILAEDEDAEKTPEKKTDKAAEKKKEGGEGRKDEKGKGEEEKKRNHIAQQNIKTWSSYWEQRIIEAQTEVEFIYRQEIEKAHAYSKSVLLSAIADSITKAHSIREDLPRHVIAQYFIHALEEYIKRTPGVKLKDAKARIEKIKEYMLYSTPIESESKGESKGKSKGDNESESEDE